MPANHWAPRARRRVLVSILLMVLVVAVFAARGTALGTGSFVVPATAQISIHYHGACGPGPGAAQGPGTLLTAIPGPPGGVPLVVNVSGDVFGCIGTDASPGTVIIDPTPAANPELFHYANVNVVTAASISATQPTPFPLTVSTVPIPTAFPSSGYIYVGSELMHYSSYSADTFTVDQRAQQRPGGLPTVAAQHPSGSFARAQGKLKLVERGQPTSNPGAGVGATTATPHSTSAQIRDPITYLTCRGRLDRTVVVNGDDLVSMRWRCYMRLEPATAWPDNPYTTWPANPSIGPVLGLTPLLYHGTSSGTIKDASTGVMTLYTEVFGLTCFPLVDGQLWIKIKQDIQLDKTALNADTGTFQMPTYTDDRCAGPVESVIGASDPNNAVYTGLDPASPATPIADSDHDGCTDYRELGPSANQGGLRDPFNPFDYSDVNHDGVINVPDDILVIAGAYGANASSARYIDYKDRGTRAPAAVSTAPGAVAGPSMWNRKGPDNTINVGDDILGVANQYGHTCPHTWAHPAAPTSVPPAPFGAHPTRLSVTVEASWMAPFPMNVVNKAGFAKSGQLLVDAETLTYNQNAGTCGLINTATQFCITARGNGTPSDNVPAQHSGGAIGAVVFEK